jgi:Flp pilus assembly protein TadG
MMSLFGGGLRAKRRRGHALMESALIFTPFITLAVGTMEFGNLALCQNSITYASTQGARWAMVRGFNSTSPASASAVTDYVRTQALGVMDPNNVTVTTTWPDGDNKPGHRVRVVVQYTYAPIERLAFTINVPIAATSEVLIRQ